MSASLEAYPPSSAEPMGTPLVEIVADGGERLGFGHLGRCLALWEELGAQAAFSVSDPMAVAFLQARGAPLVPAGAGAPLVPGGDGAPLVPAGAGTPLVPAAGGAPLVLLDRAEPTSEEQARSLQVAGRRVVLLDDLGSGRMVADAVIDPPTAAAWPPAAGMRLAGFEHVLLRREVLEAATAAHSHGGASEGGVLLAIGGSDPAGLTVPLSGALSVAGVELAVALGPGYRGAPPAVPSIAADAFAAELARTALLVCGYGHSLLEAAHAGVPAIAVVFLEQHLPHAEAFCRQGTAFMLDMTGGSRPAELVALVGDLLADGPRRARMAQRGRELVDGAGAMRIAAALHALV